MLPDRASVWVAGAGPGAAGLDFWDDVYGFSMAPVAATIREDSLRKAIVTVVPCDQVRTCSVHKVMSQPSEIGVSNLRAASYYAS